MNANYIRKHIDNQFNHNKITINVLNNLSYVDNIKEHLEDLGVDMFELPYLNVPGALLTQDNESQVFIFSDFIEDDNHLQKTLKHEICGHYCFKKVFKEEDQSIVLNQIYNEMTNDEINNIKSFYGNIDKNNIADEFLAHQVETKQKHDSKFIQSIVDKMNTYYQKNILKSKISSKIKL